MYRLRLAPPELRYPTGYGVAAAALPLLQAGKTCAPQELDAFYLRRPQAERERMKRLSAMHLIYIKGDKRLWLPFMKWITR